MTTVTLRPDATLATTGMDVTNPPNDFDQAVSDNSDGTYIRGIAPAGSAKFSLSGTTLGALRVKQARIRVRNAHDTAGSGIETGYCRLYDPAGPGVAAVLQMSRGTTAVLEQQGPWSVAGPNGQAWSQALVTRLAVQVVTTGDPSAAFLRIHEVYVDLDLNAQPVTSAVTVTGFTTSTQPTVAWSYADADGDTQSRFRVLVYSAAQYGAAGFVAGASTATVDSGDQFGDATSWQLPTDVANGTTFKAYVKTAQDWPGPEGALWWSPYVASSAFTVAVSPPATPSLTVTGEPTLPGYRNRVVINLAGVNLFDTDSASFEGGTVGGWVAGGNTNTPAVSATNPKSGINAMLLTATAAGTIEALSGTAATGDRVRPGSVVSATASFRAVATARSWQVGIRFFDVAGATISTVMSGATADTTGGYTTVTLANQSVPANAYTAAVRVLSASAAAAEQHRVDEVGLLIGPTAGWSQGGYGGGTVLVQRSQRISSSIGRGPTRNWVHPQVYSGGALTTNTDGFYARQANDSVVQRFLDRAAPESPVTATAGMIEWQIRVGSFSYLDIGAPDGTATDGMHPYLFPAVPGLAFTGSSWLWASAAVTVRLGIIFTDAFNTQVGSTTLTANTGLTTTAQKLTVAATAPAGTVYARLVVEDTLAATGLSVFVCQPKWRLSSDPDEAWPGQEWSFTWDTMRNTPYPLPTNGDDTLTLYDHEAPGGRPVLYRAQVLALAPDGTSVSSAPSVPVHTYMDPPGQPLLKDPFQPENAAVLFRNPHTISRTEDAAVFHPAGRDTDPVKITSWRGGDTIELDLETASALEQYRLENLLPASRPLLLQHHDGGQQYVLLDPATITELSPASPYYGVRVNATQCGRP